MTFWRRYQGLLSKRVEGNRLGSGLQAIHLFGFLAEGGSESELIDDFPQLTHEDVLACLGFARW
jgi:hypothetical protein